VIQTYRGVIDRSPTVRKAILSMTSEAWSFIGAVCMVAAAVAGHCTWRYIYVAFLLCEVICDTNDGYVYQNKENGVVNGYGLYLDHALDAVAAALAAYGCYALVRQPFACAVGLTLYYLIAIHSWLYKITQISRGRINGLYYAVRVSRWRQMLLNVDDLAVAMSALVITGWIPLLYIIDGALLVIFVSKFVRAVLELRVNMWHDITPE
jgi:phosphatidylglycerophosphate synthase